jgi:hypothetical protein
VPYTVTILPAMPIVSDLSYCQNDVSVALTATGSDLKWYNASVGGTAINVAPIPSTANAGTITYYVTQSINGAESERAAMNVVVNPTPAIPSVISGATVAIPASSHTYSVTNDASASEYVWTLPQDWTGTSITNSISVIVGTANGSISVTAKMGACASQTRTINVLAQAVPDPPIVSNITFVEGKTPTNLNNSTTALITPLTGATLNFIRLHPVEQLLVRNLLLRVLEYIRIMYLKASMA